MFRSKPADTPEPRGAQPPGTPRTLNLQQAAGYIGISRSHLLNIIRGKVTGVSSLQPIRVGRRLLFLPEEVDRWLREAKPTSASNDSGEAVATSSG
jgi:hypothetical protein